MLRPIAPQQLRQLHHQFIALSNYPRLNVVFCSIITLYFAMNSSYNALVRAQCARNPCLSILDKFLSSTMVTPDSSRIVSLDFLGESEPLQREVEPSGLMDQLNEALVSDKKLGKILFIENINKEIIEKLGSSLVIDPGFFASHIHSPWRGFEAQSPTFCELPSRTRLQNFASFPYHRSLLFPAIDQEDYQMLRQSNIRRKVIVFPPIHGERVGLAQHCCSVLLVHRTNSPWLGIQLPQQTHNHPITSDRLGAGRFSDPGYVHVHPWTTTNYHSDSLQTSFGRNRGFPCHRLF